MVGRLHSAARAVELGYDIAADAAIRLARADRRWREIGLPAVDRLERGIRAARREVDGAQRDVLTQRLDRLEHAPARAKERGIGIAR